MTPALMGRDEDFVGDSQQASLAKMISSGSVRNLSQKLICLIVDVCYRRESHFSLKGSH